MVFRLNNSNLVGYNPDYLAYSSLSNHVYPQCFPSTRDTCLVCVRSAPTTITAKNSHNSDSTIQPEPKVSSCKSGRLYIFIALQLKSNLRCCLAAQIRFMRCFSYGWSFSFHWCIHTYLHRTHHLLVEIGPSQRSALAGFQETKWVVGKEHKLKLEEKARK